MIMVTPEKNSIFEQAFFLVKPGVYEVDIEENEMVAEANRIISESLLFRKNSRDSEKTSRDRKSLAFFSSGLILGFALCLFCLFVFCKLGI